MDAGAVEPALTSGMLGDIGDSELVGSGSAKVAIDEIASRGCVGLPPVLAFGGKTVDSIAGHDPRLRHVHHER